MKKKTRNVNWLIYQNRSILFCYTRILIPLWNYTYMNHMQENADKWKVYGNGYINHSHTVRVRYTLTKHLWLMKDQIIKSFKKQFICYTTLKILDGVYFPTLCLRQNDKLTFSLYKFLFYAHFVVVDVGIVQVMWFLLLFIDRYFPAPVFRKFFFMAQKLISLIRNI